MYQHYSDHYLWIIRQYRIVGDQFFNIQFHFVELFSIVIKNDFASELNQFLARFYEVQYKDMTYLFIPKDVVDKTAEELVKDLKVEASLIDC